mmetsp:Transcript_55118/g.101037  ORF Transcript_55118/g.101037 Transcript_55118/m.101037 type:complete len:230 (+) Transcript_55118:300-989(+)
MLALVLNLQCELIINASAPAPRYMSGHVRIAYVCSVHEELDKELALRSVHTLAELKSLHQLHMVAVTLHVSGQDPGNHPRPNIYVYLRVQLLEDVTLAGRSKRHVEGNRTMMILQRRVVIVPDCKIAARGYLKSSVVSTVITIVAQCTDHEGKKICLRQVLRDTGGMHKPCNIMDGRQRMPKIVVGQVSVSASDFEEKFVQARPGDRQLREDFALLQCVQHQSELLLLG